MAPVEEFPIEKWNAIIAINLSAAFHAIRAALPAMKKKKWGRIITTASAHALVASPYKAAYVAAKHGLAGLTKTVALEVATQGITVNAICPGYVWTPLVEKQIPDTMKARELTEEQVKRDVILAAQPTKEFVTVERGGGAGALPHQRRGARRSPARSSPSTAAGRRNDGRSRLTESGRIAGVGAVASREAVDAEARARLKTINLGLQGGGAHGAFTWGVLDRLIEDGRLDIEAISGTSAGAMNAVVLADGYMRGGTDGARERLEAFWRGVSREGLGGAAQSILEPILSFWKVPCFPTFDLRTSAPLASPLILQPAQHQPAARSPGRTGRFRAGARQ